ncbi:metallophosphoesterase [Thermococcus sp.]|uniref:metallophosphoesterase family protein n=1 Tax=Thermococcus sp. TaxID=35749 RepID=UPI002608E696|nr:metallophosphoesterase [Thermococcus sp.]
MINFSAYRSRGSVIGSWRKLFNASRVYTVPGYWDLVKNYLPNASVEDVAVYKWGIAVLPPELGIKLLSSERVRIERVDYFGYVLYRNGYHFVGPDKGIIAVFNSKDGKRLIVTGTSRAGVGLALRELVRIHSPSDVPSFYVYRYGQFEALALKEIGDVNWDGIVEKDEYVRDYPLYYDEPFQFYWRVVGGENVSVRGAFIRLVNGSTVYLRALGFSVNVSVRPSGKNLTFVIENVNPAYLDYPKCASVNGTTIRITSTSGFIIKPLPVSNYTVIAFGDHRPAHRNDPVPEVFRKIVKEVNNRSAAFVIDNGDLVYSGRLGEWVDLMRVWHWNKPIFVSPGNHEYQGEGRNIYHYLFGPAEDFAFTLGSFGYVFLDDVDNGYTLVPAQWAFLEEWLKKDNETGRRTVIIAHAPPYDPRPNGRHTMNEASAKKLLALMREYNSFGIFSHIHMNWYGTYEGVQMIITGGAGAPLYVTDPSKGGFYGYAVLGMEKDGEIKVSFVRVG